jgi:hypothetical protein
LEAKYNINLDGKSSTLRLLVPSEIRRNLR